MSNDFSNLKFSTLRYANLLRLPKFKNSKGELAHKESDGSDWSLGDWMTALTGEVGEAANILKKIKRGDVSLEESQENLAREFADIQIYLDILAYRCGINLSKAVVEKFNEVSDRVGADVFIIGENLTCFREVKQNG